MRATDHDDVLDGHFAVVRKCGVDVELERYLSAAAQSLVGGDDQFGTAVDDAAGQ